MGFRAISGGVGLGAILALLGPVWAAGESTPAQVLSRYPSATGASLWARVQACGMKVHARQSFVDTAFADAPSGLRKKGDVTVQLIVDLPRPMGFPASGPDAASLQDVSLIWEIRGGRALPQTGWAKNVQTAPAPLQWMRC